MSLEQEFIWYSEGYPLSESADEMKKDLFFAPAPQVAYAPSPDTFDLEVDNYGGFEEFDLESSFKQIDDFFDTYHRYMPVVSTPSAVSHSTESLYEVSSSLYSCPTLSDCSTPSIQSENEFRGSVNEGLYSPHSSEYSAAFSDSPSCVPPTPANKARFDNKTIFDYGSMNLDQNFAGAQESAYVGSAAVHVVPDKAHEAVKRESVKRFRCPFCSHSSARNHNLKTHIKTHFRAKEFKCYICERQLTRKHDLQRHLEAVHGEQMPSSSSVSNGIQCSFDPMTDQPDLSHHRITPNGDPTSMWSAYPDFDAGIDVPENIIAWLMGE